MLESIKRITNQLYEERYPEAATVLLCGSVVRREHTSTSDLDLVVLFDSIPNAHRSSFLYEEWPVEAFVHDVKTLEYFFAEVDGPSGYPSLMQMVVEGVEIPQSCAVSRQAKELAQSYLDKGPPVWEALDIDKSRYAITDLIEDLRGETREPEQQAILMRLYEAFANHYFRSRQRWSGKGKWIPRRFREIDEAYAKDVFIRMKQALRGEGFEPFLGMVEEELAKVGGLLFDGFRLEAPKEWKKD